MNREIQKRKKRFWAFCFVLVFALLQIVPTTVLATEYTVTQNTDGNYELGTELLKLGDVINYNSNMYYTKSTIIYYLDYLDSENLDGEYVELGQEIIDHSNTTDETKSFTVKSYSDFQETILPAEAFKGWKVIDIYGTGGCLASISLTAIAYVQSSITYVLDGGTNASANPDTYYEGKETITLSDASKTGYYFEGWFSDAAFTTQVTSIPTTQTGEVTLYAKFSLPKEGTGTIAIDDLYYGDSIKPLLSSSTNGTDHVTVEYKQKGAADSTYTTEIPVKAGTYTARATFAATERYLEVTATDDFSILKRNGKGSVTAADLFYGKLPEPVVTSSTNGTTGVTIEYKQKNASDNTYTSVKPEKIGAYTVRAVFPETEGYFGVTATDDFSISYLDAPASPYSSNGTMGTNNYYVSDVTILPAAGYLIADSLDGTYKEKLEVTKSTDAFYVYLKNANTGEKTSGIKVSGINIDSQAPVIQNAVSGETIYGDMAEIIIQDENLSQVSVNGTPVEFTGGKAVLQLYSNQGEEAYELIGVDIAGNRSEMSVVVAADWMRSRVVPFGKAVRLYQKHAYEFGSGSWKVAGDDTTYAGNATFYVNSDGEYSFSQGN